MNERHEESRVEFLRRTIEEQYETLGGTGCGASFGELLCWEIHSNNQTFTDLAILWGVSVTTIGDLIADHCRRMEPLPNIDPALRFKRPGP